jgi:hypothetical protein
MPIGFVCVYHRAQMNQKATRKSFRRPALQAEDNLSASDQIKHGIKYLFRNTDRYTRLTRSWLSR